MNTLQAFPGLSDIWSHSTEFLSFSGLWFAEWFSRICRQTAGLIDFKLGLPSLINFWSPSTEFTLFHCLWMAKWFPCICRQTTGQIDLKLSRSFISIAKTGRLRKPESHVSHLWTRTHSLLVLQMNRWGTKKLCQIPKIILSDLRATTNSFNGCAEFRRVGPGFSVWIYRPVTRTWACFEHISMAQNDVFLCTRYLAWMPCPGEYIS